MLSYSTYLGGNAQDEGRGIAVDADGNFYVTGIAYSSDFPTIEAFQPFSAGSPDGFVTKFDSSGSVVYSTYLGGSEHDAGYDIAADAEGNAYVAGGTQSGNFPTMKALQPDFGGRSDAFVAKFDPNGALVYSTRLGGSDSDAALGIAVDAERNVYITGGTFSTDFPTRDAFQPTLRGQQDVFVSKLNASGSELVYSTYLGGNSTEAGINIAVDAEGQAYVTGQVFSTNFPTANPFQLQFGGGFGDAFVTKFDATGAALVYSTYLGGDDFDVGFGIAVDHDGTAYVGGATASRNFPTLKPFQAVGQGNDAFVTKFDRSGSAVYSTYLGGSAYDAGRGIAVDSKGNAYVIGDTVSRDFPIKDAFQSSFAGASRCLRHPIRRCGYRLDLLKLPRGQWQRDRLRYSRRRRRQCLRDGNDRVGRLSHRKPVPARQGGPP